MAAEKRAIEAQESGGGGGRRVAAVTAAAIATSGGWTGGERQAEPAEGLRKSDMLQPKRTKYRKAFKGRIHGKAKGGTTLNFGSHGLKAVEPERITARQIEAARRAITRAHEARRPRVDPHLPGRAGDEEAGRGAHGLGQGLAGAVGARASSRAASCSSSTA